VRPALKKIHPTSPPNEKGGVPPENALLGAHGGEGGNKERRGPGIFLKRSLRAAKRPQVRAAYLLWRKGYNQGGKKKNLDGVGTFSQNCSAKGKEI